MKHFLFLFILALLFQSCKKNNQLPYPMHYDYFGVEKGRYVIYNAKEINHNSVISKDTLIYQLKTVIGDTVHDDEGRMGHKFLRYTRPTSADQWMLKDVWFILINKHQGELIEENERVIKLLFAPINNKSWNGNAYNTNGKMMYTYEDVHEPFTINGISVDSTVKVVQEDEFNLIFWKKKSEIYAKGIGLVKKHYQHLNITNFNINNVTSGKELYYDMIDYGME